MSNSLEMQNCTILQVIPTLGGGGAERSVVDLTRAVVEAGGRAIVACEGGALLSQVKAYGGEVVLMPLASKNPWQIWRNSYDLQKLVSAQNIDLVHAHSRAPAWSAYLMAKRRSMPFVSTYHSLYNQKSKLKAWYNSVMARGDVVIANSEFTQGHILQRHPAHIKNLQVVYQGTAFENFELTPTREAKAQALRQAWGVESHEKLILLPGRMTRIKGHEVVLEALALLFKAGKQDLKLVFLGDYQGRIDYVEALKTKAESLGVSKALQVVDHTDDMASAYAAADIVVSASTQAEAFGRVAVEAQAMERLVIVTNIGATVETVLAPPKVGEAARTGWHVPPNAPQALAECVLEVLSLSASARHAITARARQHVLKAFGHQAMAEKTLALYQSLLSKAQK
jgi:glycosyltransferase involved in cell wall biosynthesis